MSALSGPARVLAVLAAVATTALVVTFAFIAVTGGAPWTTS